MNPKLTSIYTRIRESIRTFLQQNDSVSRRLYAVRDRLYLQGKWTVLGGSILVGAIIVPACLALRFCDESMPESKGESMPKITATDGKEIPGYAVAEAKRVFDTRFTKVGDSYYTVRVGCGPDGLASLAQEARRRLKENRSADEAELFPVLLLRMDLIQLKNLRSEVTTDELSAADRLNKITWRGTFTVKAEAERRRRLDLASLFKRFMQPKNDKQAQAQNVPWTESKMSWNLTKNQAQSLLMKEQPDEKTDDSNKIINETLEVFGALDEFREKYKAFQQGPFGDWWNPGNAEFQNSTITIRDGKALQSTNMAMENVVPEGRFGVLLNILQGGHEDDDWAFLVKPNVYALKDAGLLE